MNADVELNIFTNSTKFAPDTSVIERTYESFTSTFGKARKVNVWYDPKPNSASADTYHHKLEKLFPRVIRTSSLADGYRKSILGSTSQFLFMLEHDWEFVEKNIAHGLADILTQMNTDDILHLRFNKLENRPIAWDADLIEVRDGGLPYCITPCLGNNPHIINRENYLKEALPYIKVSSGGKSGGIEDRLLRARNLFGALYGPLGHPSTVSHLDGRMNEANTGLITKLIIQLDFRNRLNLWHARRKMRFHPKFSE